MKIRNLVKTVSSFASLLRIMIPALAAIFLNSSGNGEEVGDLLDLLVDKKLITPAESQKVQAGIAKAYSENSSAKLKLRQCRVAPFRQQNLAAKRH